LVEQTGEPVERSARLSLDQREAWIGEMRVLYCAARRRDGDWVALGNVFDERDVLGGRARLVSGCGPTELTAIERMLLRVAEQAGAVAKAG